MGPNASVGVVGEWATNKVSNQNSLLESVGDLPVLGHKGNKSILASRLDDAQPELLKEFALGLKDRVLRLGTLRGLSSSNSGMDMVDLANY